MSENSSLSILIPAYNNTESLKRALESLKKQTIANKLNILISDDCSPSPINKSEILTFKKYFSQFLFFQQNLNLGVLSNPNWLFNQVETDFFTVFQHDDVLYRKNFYEDVLNKFESNNRLVCYFGNSVTVRTNSNNNLKIHEKIQKRPLMLNFNSPKIKGIRKDGSISGEDFIDNIVNQYADFNTAWSAIVFSTRAVRKVGGFGGNYCLSPFEANILNVYREEEHFGILYLLCCQGDLQLDKEASVIRCLEPTSFSECSVHPSIKMRQDPEIFLLYKTAWHAEKIFNNKNINSILKNIYNKCSKVPLRKESLSTERFFKDYLPSDKNNQKIARLAIRSARKLRSHFEFLYNLKAKLRYYRNIIRYRYTK
mgnify:FL=1